MAISWDEKKNAVNKRKHGIGFERARAVFDDPLHLSRQDRIEDGEPRWQTIGMAGNDLLLIVAHAVYLEEGGGEHIRIISARRVTRMERRIYEEETD